jgi:hypothetical protein
MPERKFISLRSPVFTDAIDLELPGGKPLIDLLPDLLKVLNWPLTADNILIDYQIKIEERNIDLSCSLNSLGVENFDLLWIVPPANMLAEALENGPSQETGATQGHVPFWRRIPIDSPSLVSPNGLVFILSDFPLLVGRSDTGNTVQIDLSPMEGTPCRSSRRHARIINNEGKIAIFPFKTTNGTLLNGVELAPETEHLLNECDAIQFGFQGVTLFYRTQ